MKYFLLAAFLFCASLGYTQTDSTEIKLLQYKDLFIKGLISAQEYETMKAQLLGIEMKAAEKPIPSVVLKDSTQLAQDSLLRRKMYRQGIADARKYFRSPGAFAGTFFATTLGSPLLGLIPAIACSNSEPKVENLRYPDYNLYQNVDYARGYMIMSRKLKRQNVWAAWGAGFILDSFAATIGGIIAVRQSKR